MPRRNTKRFLKARERFEAAVTKLLDSLGARPGNFYDYELPTPAGLLHISVNGNWVAARFDDVALGKAFTESCYCPCNPYSGKWNFHFFDGTAASLDPKTVLPVLEYYFDQLMAWKADPAAYEDAK